VVRAGPGRRLARDTICSSYRQKRSGSAKGVVQSDHVLLIQRSDTESTHADAIGAVVPEHIVGDPRVGVGLAAPVYNTAGTGSSVPMAGRASYPTRGNRGRTGRG